MTWKIEVWEWFLFRLNNRVIILKIQENGVKIVDIFIFIYIKYWKYDKSVHILSRRMKRIERKKLTRNL